MRNRVVRCASIRVARFAFQACSFNHLVTAGVGGTQRFKEPVRAEGPIVRQIPQTRRVFNARVAREVDAALCEQSCLHRPVAGIVVGEKNRCIRIGAPGQGSIALRGRSSELAGTISGTIEGTVGGRVSRDLVYTCLSRRGEVAEWLKAMVC